MKGKTTGLKQKGFAVVLSVFMAFLMMFTGCSKIAGVLEEKLGEEEEESSVETSEEPVSEEEKEKDGLGKTFASRVVGNYKCEISHDEVALLSLYNIGGNIYGFVAQAMVEDGIDPESNIYSYYEQAYNKVRQKRALRLRYVLCINRMLCFVLFKKHLACS